MAEGRADAVCGDGRGGRVIWVPGAWCEGGEAERGAEGGSCRRFFVTFRRVVRSQGVAA